jgi:transcriptional regulator with XRE-family HTH domain
MMAAQATSPPRKTAAPSTAKRSEGSFLIARLGLTQRAIGERCAVATSTVNRWIAGDMKPRKKEREILETAFAIPRDSWDEPHDVTPPPAPAPKPTTTTKRSIVASAKEPEAPLGSSLLDEANDAGGGNRFLVSLALKVANVELGRGDGAELTPLERDKRIRQLHDFFFEYLDRLQENESRRLIENWERTRAGLLEALAPFPEAGAAVADVLELVDESRALKRKK